MTREEIKEQIKKEFIKKFVNYCNRKKCIKCKYNIKDGSDFSCVHNYFIDQLIESRLLLQEKDEKIEAQRKSLENFILGEKEK